MFHYFRSRKRALLVSVAGLAVLLTAVVLWGARSPTSPLIDERFKRFAGECKTNGVAYRTPRNRVTDREAVFGKANDSAQLVNGMVFGHPVRMHRKVMPCLQAVERDLRDQRTPYRVNAVSTYRDDRLFWFHPYGAAIDINPRQNPHCSPAGDGLDPDNRCASPLPYDLPPEWVKTFERYGFYWGGKFPKTPDYMHFEWHGEKP